MAEFRLEASRIALRSWRDDDVDTFAPMCGDPRVMATLGPVMDREQTAELVRRLQGLQADLGHCFWAMERREDGAFLGWCGLIRGSVGPIIDKAEIGWRIAHEHWGKGYAREAAMASVHWAFANLPDNRIWAITTPGNTRSWGLMERLGMVRHADLDFDHPNVAEGSELKRHITYSIGREQWTASASSR
jgi:RimJ/RimL family protein N-acetyltransferase